MKKPYYTLPWELRIRYHKLHDNEDSSLKFFENKLMQKYRRINEPGVYHINEGRFNRYLGQDCFLDSEIANVLKAGSLDPLDD